VFAKQGLNDAWVKLSDWGGQLQVSGSRIALLSGGELWAKDGINGTWFKLGTGVEEFHHGGPKRDAAPFGPRIIGRTGSGTSATISWDVPLSDGGSPINGYVVTAAPGGSTVTVGAASRSASMGGLSPGATYSFSVRARNMVGLSAPAVVSVQGTKLTLAASSPVTYGSSTTVSGNLKTSAGVALPGRVVRVLAKPYGSASYSTVGTVTTNASGGYSVRLTPSKSTSYYASYAGGPSLMGRTSAVAAVSVRQSVSVALNDATATRAQTVYFSGVVAPNGSGHRIYLQRYANGAWSNVKSMTLHSTSRYRFAWKPTNSADYTFRVYRPARSGYAAGYSAGKRLTVA
jgi:hypothetical protein